ncbi:protease modulator HflC [Pelagibacteraceae bacterium]|jgi:membrane protease subunit HflC|nr:protease modulator HflC [Pelagibacteraceae bacterium]
MKASRISIIVLGLLGLIAYLSIFTVFEIKNAIVLQFGDPKRVIMEPGLNFKIPFVQNVVFIDNRILDIDAPPAEVIASDQKRLIVDAYVKFKIIDVLDFYKTLGNENVARSRISAIVNSRIRSVLGERPLAAVLSEDRANLMKEITALVETEVNAFGISIVDVRIKRADLPEANSEAIFRRMQTEREREAKEFRAQGAEIAQRIRSTADKDVTIIKSQAEKKANIIRGEGDGEANRVFAEAFNTDPEFFAFFRAMQAYAEGLQNSDTTMILSPDSEFFKYFANPDASAFMENSQN